MPNVTISVSEKLKAEMDKLPKVNWSEICREAITRNVNEKKNPTPAMELDIRDVRLDTHHESGYPTLTAYLRIHNKMNSDIPVDRILFKVEFWGPRSGNRYHVGQGVDLYRRIVPASSVGGAQLFLPIFEQKIKRLAGEFTRTFPCIIHCTVTVDGFRNPHNQDVRLEIPIDKWKEFTKNALQMIT